MNKLRPRSYCYALAPLALLLNVACSDAGIDDAITGGGGSATGGSATGMAGAATAPTAGTPATGGGAGGSGSSAAGTGSGGQYVSVVPLAGSGQALGGGDQGAFFDVNGSVPIMPPDMAGSGGSGGSAPGIPGDGKMVTSMIRGKISGTAVFSQKGEDVTVVVTLSSCADGNHQFRIHDGYSCDNDGTEGKPWAPRGIGIGPDSGIPCSGNKGTLTYTRSGADKSKNWTVGDHVQATDVSAHVVIVSDEKDPNSRASCGNFF